MEYSQEIIERAEKIKVLILDVDGVLTDGRLIYGNFGDELKNFYVNDGLGILFAKMSGIKCVILTAKASRIVKKRAKDLKIDKVYQNLHDKLGAFEKICRKFKVKKDETCFIGDDVIDIAVLKRVGLAVAPSNAMKEVKAVVHMITEQSGGRGAVREVCELILGSQGKWDDIILKYSK